MLTDIGAPVRDVPVWFAWDNPPSAVEERDPNTYILLPGQRDSRPDNVAYQIRVPNPEEGLAPFASRLRVTWIRHFLGAGVPESILCTAARADSAEPWSSDALPDEHTLRAVFSGEVTAL
ncbi:hypothetical protein [Corynebacterium falsenii]